MNRTIYTKEQKTTRAANLHGTKKPENLFYIGVNASGPRMYQKSGAGGYIVCARNEKQAVDVLRAYLKAKNKNGDFNFVSLFEERVPCGDYVYSYTEQAFQTWLMQLMQFLHKQGVSGGYAVCTHEEYQTWLQAYAAEHAGFEEINPACVSERMQEAEGWHSTKSTASSSRPAKRTVHGAFGKAGSDASCVTFADCEITHDMEGITYEGMPLYDPTGDYDDAMAYFDDYDEGGLDLDR